VLFVKDFSLIDRTNREELARLHAEALVKRYTGQANAWMRLCDSNDSGSAGGAFILSGDDAIPALVPRSTMGRPIQPVSLRSSSASCTS
jgi:hypothetical protein